MFRLSWLIRNVEEIIGSIMLSVMTLSVILGVFARTFHISIVWTDELGRYSFIWTVFIGSVVAMKRKEHVALDFILKSLSGTLYKVLYTLIQLVLILVFANLFIFGTQLSISSWNVPTTSLEIPTGLVYLSVPIASLLMIMYVIIDIWKTFRSDKNISELSDTAASKAGEN